MARGFGIGFSPGCAVLPAVRRPRPGCEQGVEPASVLGSAGGAAPALGLPYHVGENHWQHLMKSFWKLRSTL